MLGNTKIKNLYISINQDINRFLKWSRRESNPGPNKQFIHFLRAYFLIEFQTQWQARNSHTLLNYFNFENCPQLTKFQVLIYDSPVSNAKNQSFRGESCFPTWQDEANLTIIRIMQQERSFLRRVNVLKPFINENCPSSRRAYVSIRLAVKTSRPLF